MDKHEGRRGHWGGGVVFIRVMLRGASGSKRGRMLWFIQSRRRCGEGGDADKVCVALSTRPPCDL